MSTTANKLSSQTSPYLLQHATNPVNWYPWGDEAFTKAKEENKLLLISIGYSSCHWCHVMEKESFSNMQVAEFMNEHYVCIKVDREERPDVDQIYLNAVQIITRSGGWPLNCFALPNGKPVYGGTYFKSEAWLDILKSLHFTWMTEPKKVIEVANELTEGISVTEIISEKVEKSEFDRDFLPKYVKDWSKYFDKRYGANKGAPKFAMPGSLQFLLDYAIVANDEEVKQHVKLTLDKMQLGGIYDHLGGGFYRYSVDEQWFVPHFEKMLYDNAQLIRLYANAYRVFKDDNYRSLVYQTADFLRRELRSKNKGFYSALDADSEGEEGKFYTFSKQEIDSILGHDAELFSIVYGVTGAGVLMGNNVLRVASSINETASLMSLPIDEVTERLKIARTKLLNVRNTRIRPTTDDKIILSWNALAVTAFAKAYQVFGDSRFLTDAIDTITFLEETLIDKEQEVYRIHCKGKTTIPAFLDDYTFLIQAYINLYQADFNEDWLLKAKRLTEQSIEKFFDDKTGMFYLTSLQHDNIIVRKMDITDGVLPSSGAAMADNLVSLGVYFRNENYTNMAKQMIGNIAEQLHKGGPFVYKWAHAYLRFVTNVAELTTAGDDSAKNLWSVIRKVAYPNLVPYIYQPNSKLPIANQATPANSFKLCIGEKCALPTSNPNEIITALETEKPLE
ncbi:MAG: thioredoxin domain-containing protein [Tenuifilaceae bacterium]|nr:thioredoxin domain-containing protein [Tenuifilaceae bacterium]